MVQDGERLFIDRDGNGDLTEPGECVKGRPPSQTNGPTEFGPISVLAKKGVLTKTTIEVQASPSLTFVYCHAEGQPWQRAVVDAGGYLAFSRSPQTAPVLHFQGPLTIGLRFNREFKRHSRPEDFDVFVGTPGIGPGSFVRFGNASIANEIHPELEIDFPRDNGATIHVKMILDKRC